MIYLRTLASASASAWLYATVALLGAYLIGSIPWAYIIVRGVTGEDITTHGSGNVGAMNVRRTTDSWAWFAVAMVADASKGFVPVGLAWAALFASGHSPASLAEPSPAWLLPQAALLGAVLGHNYSLWLALKKKRFVRTGKGLATGGGALLAYDWRYFLVALVVGLLVIAVSRYMMAGQVAAALSVPAFALATRQPDWPFALLIGLFVYAAHHKRFVGLLRGREPKFYIHDRQGPQG